MGTWQAVFYPRFPKGAKTARVMVDLGYCSSEIGLAGAFSAAIETSRLVSRQGYPAPVLFMKNLRNDSFRVVVRQNDVDQEWLRYFATLPFPSPTQPAVVLRPGSYSISQRLSVRRSRST